MAHLLFPFQLAQLALLLGAAAVLVKEAVMSKVHLPDPDAATEAFDPVPAQTPALPVQLDYPSWIDQFEQQVSALALLSRQGNRVAFNLLADLWSKYQQGSDQASDVAAIFEHIGG